MPRINREQLERFFRECLLVDDRSCVEVLIPRSTYGPGRRIVASRDEKAFGGWFTSPDEMAIELGRVENVSAYCAVNPVRLGSRPAEGRNTLRSLRKGEGAGDADITVLRWMSIDVDPPREHIRSASTAAELADSIGLRNRILEAENLMPHALCGLSGNGAIGLVRLPDLPNDRTSNDAIGSFILSLDHYKTELGSHVDTQKSVYAPSRMIAIPGTLKCRGDVSTPDRPWRQASMDVCDVTPFDLVAWVDRNGLVRPDRSRPGAARRRPKDAYRQAREWLFSGKVNAARSGQEGHNQTFGVACSLVKGFMLTPDESLSLLREWNAGCSPPWEDYQLAHKIAEAEKEPDRQPRGWMIRSKPSPFDNLEFTEGDEPTPANDASGPFLPDVSGKPEGPIDDPVRLATLFSVDHQVSPGCCRYRYHAGVFWMWDGSHYRQIMDKDFDSIILLYIDRKMEEYNRKQYENTPPGQQDDIKLRRPNRATVELCKSALRGIISIEGDRISDVFWIGTPSVPGWKPSEIIPFANRLVHLPSFAIGKPKSWIAKTPNYFNTYSLSYRFPFDRYDGPVEPPPTLRHFMESTHGADPESIQCLREIAGYILTPSNRFQKLFMLIGTRRSGKGTWLRIFEHMIGINNTSFPTFSSLAAVPFGKQQLLNKTLAVMGDARLSGRTDVSSVVETILSITGNDPQTIQRKYAGDVTQRLSCRFVITSNELPRFNDMSGALLSRAVIIRFSESFEGREDRDLEDKLLAEIPAITRWAIDGWVSLHERGQFIQPQSGQDLLDELRRLVSPVLHFADEMMEIGQSHSEGVKTAYMSYKDWCSDQGRENVGDKVRFERDLTAALAGTRIEKGTIYGVRLKPPSSNGESMAHTNGSAFPDNFNPY